MSIRVYTKADLRKLNVYALRVLPSLVSSETVDRYAGLRRFINDEVRSNLSNIIKRPIVPEYLKEKYVGPHRNTSSIISRGNYHDQRGSARRKLYTAKNETEVEQTNEKIRDILSKLSEGNKSKLLAEFSKIEIADECGSGLIENIYTFAADLDYLIPYYVELIVILKERNIVIYDQLIEKIIQTSFQPLVMGEDIKKAKRWRLANIKLVAEIYLLGDEQIDFKMIESMIDGFYQVVSPSQPDELEVLSELLKRILPLLKKTENSYTSELIEKLEPIGQDHQYDIRSRFFVQDIIEIFDTDEDADD
jgi:hypothetical protein